jgi:PAS domain S-box-containing protein
VIATAPTHHTPRFDARWLMEVITLAALYFLTARLGLLMAMPGGHVTPVWPPSGIALAAVLLRGRRVWPGIWLGSFAANILDFYGSPLSLATELATSATFGIGASLAALLGSQLLRWFMSKRNPLEQVRDVCAFMALGGVVSCLVSATVGVTTLCLAGYVPWSVYGQAWLTWWLGDTGGVFIVAPLLLVWGGTHRRKLAGRWVELLGGFGLLIAVTYYVFCENTTALSAGKPLTFIILMPFLVWAAVRFGRRGAAAAVGLIALLALWGTLRQTGPFNLGQRNEALLLLELFLGVMVLTALCLAAMVTEREHVAAAQQRAVEELESHVRERTSALVQSEAQARQHLAEAERARAALLSILEDQQQTEAALRESQARTRLLIKSSNIGLWDWNLVTNEMFFSPEGKSQLGYANDEMPNHYEEWESRLHPEDREPTLRAVQDFCESRRDVYDLHFRMRHKDGSWRWILVRADLIYDAAGQPVRMMGCHIDITERKQAEQARHESDERFRQIAENINEVFWVWTAAPGNARCLYVSPAYATIWGRSCESLYSSPQSWKEALHPQDKEWVLKEIARLDFEKISDWTYRILRPDQSIRWIRDRIFPVRDANGVVVRFAGIAEDITESKTIEKALESAEEQYHSIFNNAVDGIFRTSPDGKFLVANPAAAHIFGFASPEELIEERRDIAQQGYVDPHRREEFKRLLQEQGAVNGFEYEAYRKDGSQVWISENTRAVHAPSGEILYFEGIFEDVTDRKRAEAALQMMRFCVDHAGDGVFWVSPEGRLLYVNESTCERLGYSESELLGLKIFDLDPDYQPGVWATHWEELKRRGTITLETRHRTKAGRVFPIEVNANYVCAGGQEFNFAFTRDITQRKQAEEKLWQSLQLLRAITEGTTDAIFAKDREGRYLMINTVGARFLGKMPEKVIGLDDRILERDRAIMRTGETRTDEDITATRAGLNRVHLTTKGALRDSAGTIIGLFGVSRDITERKQAEEALNAQALRYKTLMETSTDSIYVLDENGDLQEANAAFLDRRGYTAADVKGLSVADWDARWTREQLQTKLRKLADSGGVFETRHRCKDGSIFDVEVCATSVRIGEEQLFFCVTRDISTRKKAESALRQLAQVSAASSDYIALIGRDFRYQFVNDTYLKARGLHLEDIIGRHMKEIVGQERFEQLGRPQVEACLRGEEVESFEWTDFRSDLRCFLHVKVEPLREPDGTISGAVMSGRDITARHEAERVLQESDERFRQITENINEIFWVWTVEPGQKHCLYVSPAYATIWGCSCESLYAAPGSWREALHPNDKEWVLAEFTDPDVAKPIDLTYRIVRSDQSIRWIRDRIFPVRDARGVVIRSTGIAEDVTESKRAEETVQKANREMRILSRRRIQEQENERRRLSRELHDQIGQSLTAAKLNVEALRSKTSPALIGRLDETTAILDQLLDQVRQISLDLRPPMLDDLGLVPALRSWLDEQSRRASVAVRFSAENIPEKLDPEIQITCFRIAQEAITNAVRHAKATQLDIALRCARGKTLRLLARDNGIGFNAQSAQAQAVDLGLIGIRERAALVGGRAKIISSPRKGTTIQVSLPLTFRPGRQARHM